MRCSPPSPHSRERSGPRRLRPSNAPGVGDLDIHERLAPPGITIPTLVFEPSEDIEAIAAEVLRVRLRHAPIRRALLRVGHYRAGLALVSSFLLLDGSLAARLIELGRRDAHAARDRIEAFFGD